METPFMTGLVVAAAAYAGRYGILAWQTFKARPAGMRQFYQGGFHASMNKREAALILGVRREKQILRLLKHPYIIELYEVIETETDIYLVTEDLKLENMLLDSDFGLSNIMRDRHFLKTSPNYAVPFYHELEDATVILGVRTTHPTDKIKEAHRRVMVANHPDAGGSHYLASKINEAKEILLGKTKVVGVHFENL